MTAQESTGSPGQGQVDLAPIAARRSGGESLDALAKELGWTRQKLEKRMRRGYPVRRTSKRPKAATATPAAPPAVQPAVKAAVEAVIPTAPQDGVFVEPSWYPLLRYAMTHEKGATMFGPRGCGKSTAIRELAREVARPTVTFQCAANMQVDSLLGCWTSQSGTLSFIDGPLTVAVRTGAWLLAEEANVIHPGVWSTVNTLTDHTGEGLRLPTGEVVPANPNFRLVLIYNEGYSGTREVNGALKDRLMPIYCGYLKDAEEIKLLTRLTNISEAESRRVVEVATMVRSANLRFDLSPRSLVRWVKLTKEAGLGWQEAFEHAIVDLAGPADVAAAQRACLEEIGRNTVSQWEVSHAE